MTLVVLVGLPAISEYTLWHYLCYYEPASELFLVHHMLALIGAKCGFTYEGLCHGISHFNVTDLNTSFCKTGEELKHHPERLSITNQ